MSQTSIAMAGLSSMQDIRQKVDSRSPPSQEKKSEPFRPSPQNMIMPPTIVAWYAKCRQE
eukprot:c43564_g1_i1 orf=67-246(+)